MTRDERPANVHLRMSAQLRDGLHASAVRAGCSLNAYAVQVLAAAAGDPARFRMPGDANQTDVRAIKRDHLGFPLDPGERWKHLAARGAFMDAMRRDEPDAWMQIVRKHDLEDPEFFVEWKVRIDGVSR